MNDTPPRRRIGNSILPSSCSRILAPIVAPFGLLQVHELHDEDTHALILTTAAGSVRLASHPNGYSCHSLAERMVSGNHERVKAQAEYIVACGGKALPTDAILAMMI